MKILAFVDTHGSVAALKTVVKKAKKADIVVCAGDLSIFEQSLKEIISKLDEIGKPVLIIPGNHETDTELKKICSSFKNVHFINKGRFEIDDYLFLGYEGNGFSMLEPEFEKTAVKFRKWMTNKKKIVLVTHAPPYGTNIDAIMEEHCGNKTIREFIDRSDIELVISGHLHENAGKKDKIGKTAMINPDNKL